MIFFKRKCLLDTLMQIFIMLRHLVAEISRFKFDDYRVIRTGASDLKLFWGGVYAIYTNNLNETHFLVGPCCGVVQGDTDILYLGLYSLHGKTSYRQIS